MKKDLKSLDEFRKHRGGDGHIHYVFGRRGNHLHSMGLTGSPYTKATKDTPESHNLPLKKNPKPNDDTQSYVRPFSIIRHKDKYGELKSGWKFGENDLPLIEKIKKRAEPTRIFGGLERHKVKSITGHTRQTKVIIRKKKNKVNYSKKKRSKRR
jgi:hypothetical protein